MISTELTELEISKAYKKSAKYCKNKAKNYLFDQNLSYNPSKEIWKYNRQTIDYEIVYLDLLQWSRENNTFREHGLFVEEVLTDVMTDPNFTGPSYLKSKIVRKRGNRISGKLLFLEYCRHTGIKIIGSIEEFTIKNNHIVKKFYDYLAKCLTSLDIIKRARIFGKLFSSVFVGIDLKDDAPTHHSSPPSNVPNLSVEPLNIPDSTTHFPSTIAFSPPN